MEIIVEILVGLLQLLAEAILQLVFEVLGEIGLHSMAEPFQRRAPPNPVLAAIGYAIFGAIAGGISLWLFPALFIRADWLRIANLALTPLAAGVVMGAIGAWRRRRGENLIRLDRFSYAFLFALAMATVRFVWGH